MGVWADGVTGALLYAAAMAAATAASGQGLQVTEHLMEGAMMGVAIVADDMTHSALGYDASVASSAVMTGGWFALLEGVARGDTRYARNLAAGAVTSVVVDSVF